MLGKLLITLLLSVMATTAFTQENRADTSLLPGDPLSDTSILDYDELFRDFDAFMDSILSPRSFLLTSLSAGRGYYTFETKDASLVAASKRLTYSPTIAYFHKSGLGINVTGFAVNDDENLNLYQAAITPSYDYIEDRRIATGISYTRYFTKDSLPFYTTPLQNEVYAYFTYRSSWFKPSITASYGWGNRSEYEERESLIQDLRLRRFGYTYVNTKESIRDFTVTASVRHDFYWLDVLANRDHIRLSPQLAFTSGTQKFGFNRYSSTYATVIRTGNNVLFSAEELYLDSQTDFQPLSLTFYLRGQYALGKFFIQPQFMLDYYIPGVEENFSSLFSVNLGCIF
jgi:hypothetical protein